jgi:ParB family transcriptional regulator, chromosome partitioning protein
VGAAMEMELHQLELRYEGLRRRSARKERAVLASLSEIGQQAPVVVLEVEEQRAVLLDGYKRVRALKRLGRDTVLATRWELPEPEALLLERLMRTAEAESPLEQGWLLREMHERFGLSAGELAQRFDKSTSWVSRRLALVSELPEPIQEQVRQGQLVAHAAMKHLVPLARANRREAERLAKALGARQLSSREVGTLCTAWRSGSPATRELILSNPEVVLRAQQEARRPPEPLGPEQRLLKDLAALAGIARRAAGLLRESGWQATAREELSRAARSAQADTESLFTLCRKELCHVRSESADCHSGAA